MNRSIQTPLISQQYYRNIPLKRFTVVSDSLAPLMWRGYELHCLPVRSVDALAIDTLVVVECQVAGRKRVSYQVGYVQSVEPQTLTLSYDSEDFATDYPDWLIPTRQIKRAWEVNKVARVFAHLRKFYPCSRYGK